MKLYISLDMEGIPGTWNWDQEKSDRIAVKRAIFNHTKDVLEAIIESPQSKDINEIVLADSHSDCDNLSYEITEIDRRIKLISGIPRPCYMMPAFGDQYDMVFFLGYHAGYGVQNANMDHTYSDSRIHRLLINDIPMNETLVNAAYAGTFGVPVTLITGDRSLKNSLKDNRQLDWVEFVITKEAIAKFAVINYSALLVRDRIKESVGSVMSNAEFYKDKLYEFSKPIRLSIELKSTSMADAVSVMPGIRRIDGRIIEYINDDYRIVFETIIAITDLAYSVSR